LEAKDEAEKAKRTQVMFLANMSHEIRTPLNAILGYAQILRHNETRNGASPSRALDVILRSGENLLELIDSLISVSRAQAGGLTLAQDTFDFRGTLAMLRDMFAPQAASRGLDLDLVIAGTVPCLVNGDEAKIRQVILNLVSNAFRFTQRGRISINAELISTSAGPHPDYLMAVGVKDTGCGIAPEEQTMIFEEFKQAAAGRRLLSGVGLGLALSRHYAKLMGGGLSVQSTPGRGSLFTFSFKVKAAAGEPRSLPDDTAGIARLANGEHPRRLLVVDDDEANRDMLKELLSLAGFDVRTANAGEDVFLAADAWKPDVVLLDKGMSEMADSVSIQRLKASHTAKPPIVILVSADVLQEPGEEGSPHIADGYIAKPIRPPVLFAELKRLLNITYAPGIGEDAVVLGESHVETGAVRWLPREVRTQMCDVIDRGDMEELREQIDRCRPAFPQLARQLRYLADRFAYDRMKDLLNPVEDTDHEPS
jgi:CheY-like chemotaxis protein